MLCFPITIIRRRSRDGRCSECKKRRPRFRLGKKNRVKESDGDGWSKVSGKLGGSAFNRAAKEGQVTPWRPLHQRPLTTRHLHSIAQTLPERKTLAALAHRKPWPYGGFCLPLFARTPDDGSRPETWPDPSAVHGGKQPA